MTQPLINEDKQVTHQPDYCYVVKEKYGTLRKVSNTNNNGFRVCVNSRKI